MQDLEIGGPSPLEVVLTGDVASAEGSSGFLGGLGACSPRKILEI